MGMSAAVGLVWLCLHAAHQCVVCMYVCMYVCMCIGEVLFCHCMAAEKWDLACSETSSYPLQMSYNAFTTGAGRSQSLKYLVNQALRLVTSLATYIIRNSDTTFCLLVVC